MTDVVLMISSAGRNTQKKSTKATDVASFPSKTNFSMYDDYKTRGKKKKQKSGADHHIVCDTAES